MNDAIFIREERKCNFESIFKVFHTERVVFGADPDDFNLFLQPFIILQNSVYFVDNGSLPLAGCSPALEYLNHDHFGLYVLDPEFAFS